MSWLALILAVLLNALANVLVKAGATRVRAALDGGLLHAAITEPMLYAGVLAFALALAAYVVALGQFELSVAYPLMTSLGLVIVAIASWQWFGETYDVPKTVATLLIVAGVLLLTWGGRGQ